MEVEHALDVEPIKKPAKRWVNWWEVLKPSVVCPNGSICKRGTARELKVYPSKDVANTAAENSLRTSAANSLEYIGAYPEGERP